MGAKNPNKQKTKQNTGLQCWRDPGWPFWANQLSQGKVKREAGFWLREPLGLVHNSLKACVIFVGFQGSFPPHTSHQLDCFLTGPVWVWGHQSSFLRLGGTLLPLFMQNYLHTFYQMLGAPVWIISVLVFFIHLAFQTKEPLTGVTLFLPPVTSMLVPTSHQCLFFLNTIHYLSMRSVLSAS